MPLERAELEAGILDKRVSLLAPVYAEEFQDEIADWQEAARVWAAVEPAAGNEQNEAGRMIGVAAVSVTIRFRADLDLRWRIRDGPHTYEILAIQDTARRRAQLKLSCAEVK